MPLRAWLGPACALVLWLVLTSGPVHVNPLFLPTPQAVLLALGADLISGELPRHALATLGRMSLGFLLSIAWGLPLGVAFGLSPRTYTMSEVLVDFLRSLPSPVLVPLAMLAFGVGDFPKVAIVAFSCGLINAVNTFYAVRGVKQARVMAARTLGASSRQIISKVVIPDATPLIIGGLRVTLSLSLIIAIVTEMVMGSTHGLGTGILNLHLMYQVPRMYALIVTTGLLGYLTNRLFVALEARYVHWAGK